MNRPRRIAWMCGWVVMLSVCARAQTPPAPCDGAHFKELDFWIGRWSVANAAGQPAGSSVVERVADGCGVLETYSGAPGSRGGRYAGVGLHAFDGHAGRWHQTFADNRPAVTLMTGRAVDGTVVYEWRITDAQGRAVAKRYTLSKTATGVRQFGEQSLDEGRTWTTDFDLRYTKTA